MSSPLFPDPQSINLVLYHDGCPDGFGAAYAAWKALGPRAEYLGCDHGSSTVPSVRGRRVVILDFSFKADVTRRMIQEAECLLVIDHHSTAAEELKSIPDCHKIFDLTRSGCILAWEFFHGPRQLAPQFLYYVQDRDLWQWRLRQAQEVCAALDTYPQTFEQWDQFSTIQTIVRLKDEGKSVLRYRQRLVESVGSKSVAWVWEGLVCRVVNTQGGSLVSFVGQHLLDRYHVSLALLWYIDYPSRQIKVSLRSRPEVDCSALALKFGGGGHPQASAFTVALDDAASQWSWLWGPE